MRLVDADAVYELHSNYPAFARSYADLTDLRDILDDAPTIEAEPVKHGRWIDAREYCGDFMCSNCNALYGTNKFNYCPNCGAKMDEGDSDD